MSFLNEEESQENAQPLEIYHFSIGNEDFYYTTSEDVVTYAAIPYVPRQISRNATEASIEAGSSKLEVTLPTDDPVCVRYIGIVQPEPMNVRVTRFHRADLLDGLIIWDGRVIQAAYRKQASQCTLTVVASESVFSRPIPQFKYQSLCNHVLYDNGCTVAKTSYQYDGSASSVVGSSITVAGLVGGGRADGWSLGGMVQYGDDSRLIVAQTGDVLQLSLPFRADPTGQQVSVFAGCDHTNPTCNSKFSNSINFGGFPEVPTKNPFTTRLV